MIYHHNLLIRFQDKTHLLQVYSQRIITLTYHKRPDYEQFHQDKNNYYIYEHIILVDYTTFLRHTTPDFLQLAMTNDASTV